MLLTHTTTWVDLEDIMQVKSHKRTNTIRFHLKEVKFIETESKREVTGGWGIGGKGISV